MKTCTVCNEPKDETLFHLNPNFKCGRNSWCKECNKAKNRDYNKRHREKMKVYHRSYYRELKEKVITGYGCICVCCGESERLFLTLDHVNGGGHQHRKAKGSNAHYLDAFNRAFPSDYQILCYNCNMTKGFYGACPHKSK